MNRLYFAHFIWAFIFLSLLDAAPSALAQTDFIFLHSSSNQKMSQSETNFINNVTTTINSISPKSKVTRLFKVEADRVKTVKTKVDRLSAAKVALEDVIKNSSSEYIFISLTGKGIDPNTNSGNLKDPKFYLAGNPISYSEFKKILAKYEKKRFKIVTEMDYSGGIHSAVNALPNACAVSNVPLFTPAYPSKDSRGIFSSAFWSQVKMDKKKATLSRSGYHAMAKDIKNKQLGTFSSFDYIDSIRGYASYGLPVSPLNNRAFYGRKMVRSYKRPETYRTSFSFNLKNSLLSEKSQSCLNRIEKAHSTQTQAPFICISSAVDDFWTPEVVNKSLINNAKFKKIIGQYEGGDEINSLFDTALKIVYKKKMIKRKAEKFDKKVKTLYDKFKNSGTKDYKKSISEDFSKELKKLPKELKSFIEAQKLLALQNRLLEYFSKNAKPHQIKKFIKALKCETEPIFKKSETNSNNREGSHQPSSPTRAVR